MVPPIFHPGCAEIDSFLDNLRQWGSYLPETHGVPCHASNVDLAQGFDQTLDQLGSDDFGGRVCDIHHHLSPSYFDRVGANRLAPETAVAALIELELPVVPGAGERLLLDIALQQGIPLVRAPIVDCVDRLLSAEQGDPLVIVTKQFPAPDREIVDTRRHHPVSGCGSHVT